MRVDLSKYISLNSHLLPIGRMCFGVLIGHIRKVGIFCIVFRLKPRVSAKGNGS